MGRSRSSHELTVDTQISQKHGYLCGLEIITDGTNDATGVLYDVSSSDDVAANNKLCEVKVIGANHYGGRNFTEPVKYVNGLYLDLTGSGASAIVEYKR